MRTRKTLIYWREGNVFKGKLEEHPHIIEKGETIEELEHNIYSAYEAMILEDVPGEFEVKEFWV